MAIVSQDAFSHIQYVDGDFTWGADVAPSGINTRANVLIVDEVEYAAYIISQFAWDNAGEAVVGFSIPLKFFTDGEADSGVRGVPFLLDPDSDGVCSLGVARFQNTQTDVMTEGVATLKKDGGVWVIVCNVSAGDYDRVQIELNYQIDTD